MRLRPDWVSYLHETRERELRLVFSRCPAGVFGSCLELGAGDGFLSRLLTQYAQKVTSTDLNLDRLRELDDPRVERRVCDAEHVDEVFEPGQFDLVFSCALLLHLPEAQKALRGIHRVVKDEGVTVHVVPNPLWAVCHVLLHIPVICIHVLENLTEKGGVARIRERIQQETGRTKDPGQQEVFDNNPKVTRAPRSVVFRFFVPAPVGVSASNIREFLAFREARWRTEFDRAGFEVVAIVRGSAASGYGLGLRWARRLLEWVGISTENIYVAVKKGAKSPYAGYFENPR